MVLGNFMEQLYWIMFVCETLWNEKGWIPLINVLTCKGLGKDIVNFFNTIGIYDEMGRLILQMKEDLLMYLSREDAHSS